MNVFHPHARRRRAQGAIAGLALMVFMLLAAVSHTSTFVLLSAHVAVAAAWLWLAQPDRRATAWRSPVAGSRVQILHPASPLR